MMCFATWATSESSRLDDELNGEIPDLESSPDVLIWMKTLNGDLSADKALFRAVAALAEPIVCTQKRLGIAVQT